ncbi:MAG: hypothetical protein ACRC9R_09505 [Enterovibrio sp.]
MGIDRNGGGHPPHRPPGDDGNARRRRRDSASDTNSDPDTRNGGRARNNQAANAARRRDGDNNSLLQQVVLGVRNIMGSPLTVAGMIVGAVVTSQALSWLLSASSLNNSLSGALPDLGGAPPPPPLGPSQENGQAPPPPSGPPIPTLEEILARAGYPPEEQARLQASEQPSAEGEQGATASQEGLPPCPDEVVFITCEYGANGEPPPPSQTREQLTSGEAQNLCSGPQPRVSVRPIPAGRPRFQCRDTATGTPSTPCSSQQPPQPCPPGEQVEQCAGASIGNWGEGAGSACMRANAFGRETTVVLENTHTPQEMGTPPTNSESDRFDQHVDYFCRENTEIYSEDPAFDGASAFARDRVQFGSRPEDILRRRNRAEYRAQRAEEARARQNAEQSSHSANAEATDNASQEDAQTSAQPPNDDGAQGATSSNEQSQDNGSSEQTDIGNADPTKQADQ